MLLVSLLFACAPDSPDPDASPPAPDLAPWVEEHVVEQSLTSLAASLPGFVRVHRGELVRLAAIVRVGRDEAGAFVELASGEQVRVSRRQLSELTARLQLR